MVVSMLPRRIDTSLYSLPSHNNKPTQQFHYSYLVNEDSLKAELTLFCDSPCGNVRKLKIGRMFRLAQLPG